MFGQLLKQEGAIVVKAASLARLGATTQHLASRTHPSAKHLITPILFSTLVTHVLPMPACDLPCFAWS